MEYTYKKWEKENYYNFFVEFNRIESYNEYCKSWLNNYFNKNVAFISKTDWQINDIVDIKDYNRVKTNINLLLSKIESLNTLNVSSQFQQTFNVEKANEMENALKEYLQILGQWQFTYNRTGLTTTGSNNLKLVG